MTNGNKIATYAVIDAVDVGRIGCQRWHRDKDGYAIREIRTDDGQRTRILMHREILGILDANATDGDHRNRDRLDNRRTNLRPATRAQNRQNVSKPKRPTSSRFRGVTWSKRSRKWAAQVMIGKRNHHFGLYDTEEAAAQAARDGREILLPYATD